MPILPGAFITIEGIDGSGKSTLAGEVAKLGRIAGRPIHVIRKDSPIGAGYVARHAEGLRNILWGERSEQRRGAIADTHWLWLAASWFALVEQVEVLPKVRQGYVVLSDSWFEKILARFSLKAPAVAEHAASVAAMLRQPDWTLLLDVAPQLAADRKNEFGYSECGNFDGLKGRSRDNFLVYQGRVRRIYLGLAAERNWTTVATTVPASQFGELAAGHLAWR